MKRLILAGILLVLLAGFLLIGVNWSFLRPNNQNAGEQKNPNLTLPYVNPDTVSAGNGVVFYPDAAIENIRKNAEQYPAIKRWLNKQFELARESRNRAPRPAQSLQELADNLDLSASAHVEDEFYRLLALSLDARMSGNKDSLRAAQEYLLAWARAYKPLGHPDVESALSGFVIGYELVRKDLSADDRSVIDIFLNTLYTTQKEYIVRSDFNGHEWSSKWSLHALNLAVIAFLQQDREKIAYVKSVYLDQLSRNILPAGKLEDFYPRDLLSNTRVFDRFPFLKNKIYDKGVTFDFIYRDALLYHRSSIESLYNVALVAKNNGEDWYLLKGEKGQTLEWAFDFLIPYATGVKKHYEFENTLLSFDTENKRQAWFKTEDGIATLTLAMGLYPQYKKYANLETLGPIRMLIVAAYP